jgi:class 3 adenylate cyclase
MRERARRAERAVHGARLAGDRDRVAINTGTMRVGDMGSKLCRACTVMGDAVNLAPRLEGITKHSGVGILVG